MSKKLIPKYQHPSGPIGLYLKPEDINKGLTKVSEWILKGMGKVGEAFNEVAASALSTPTGTATTAATTPVNNSGSNAKVAKEANKLAKLFIERNGVVLSPSSWIVGKGNPYRGAEIISLADPRLQVVALGADIATLAKAPKAVKTTAKKTITATKSAADKAGIFVLKPNTYTRGIGIGTEGLLDLIETGVVRGNPRGTEVTAKLFAKMWRRDRNRFKSIIQDTGIEGILNRFFSRTLTESDFNAIKNASKNYNLSRMQLKDGTFETIDVSADPLIDYPTYLDYLLAVLLTVDLVNKMPVRVASGEITPNLTLRTDIEGNFRGRPIEERFGANSDYVADGTPLNYWYNDGRNPLTKGYDYAGSKYGIRVNNPETYTPFIHDMHLHPSFFRNPRLVDPNVEVFKRYPFGITLRMNKAKLIKELPLSVRSKILSPLEFGQIETTPTMIERPAPIADPAITRFTRLLNKKKAGMIPETDLTLIVRNGLDAAIIEQELVNAYKKLGIEEKDARDMAKLTMKDYATGSHVPIASDEGQLLGGISYVDEQAARLMLQKSGIKNPTKLDINTIIGHEVGHQVEVPFSDKELYTKMGLILDNEGITAANPNITVEWLNDAFRRYLSLGRLDNGLSAIYEWFLDLPYNRALLFVENIKRYSMYTGAAYTLNNVFNKEL